jgi:hypothetical protein
MSNPDQDISLAVHEDLAALISEALRPYESEPYMKDAMGQVIVREFVWALFNQYADDCHFLPEQLETLADCVRDRLDEEIQRRAAKRKESKPEEITT